MIRLPTLYLFLLACIVLAACSPQVRMPASHVAQDGEQVAAAINARYQSRTVECAGEKPAYFCAGVIYRAIYWNPLYHFWNNRQDPNYDGVSFSYLHYYSGDRRTFHPAGYILGPASEWGQGGSRPLAMYCSFTFDGWTGPNRGIHGCGKNEEIVGSEPCAEQGIDTVSKYARHFVDAPNGSVGRWMHSCSFATNWRAFLLSILARQGGALEQLDVRYSEQVISNWPEGLPTALPIEALYYDPEHHNFDPEHKEVSGIGLDNARALQADYRAVTGRTLWILRFNQNPRLPLFTFHPEDQQDEASQPVLHRPAGVTPTGGGPLTYHEDEAKAGVGSVPSP
ncbi:MAG TPA: hypothetical protein VGN46_20300 [Luteibacter sp.]|jgi:hypothetical protein|uniref:hypothetical protein n=1 Tax=Luteibacter sp. TaxID=1886636 RepID=UPI002F42D0FB